MDKGPLSFDPSAETRRISSFVKKIVGDAGADGVVIGLSGGIDSSVVGALCVEALGKDQVMPILMPSEHTPSEDMEDARELAKSWNVKLIEANISNLVDELASLAGTAETKMARANAQARIRMTILYYHANARNLLVAGTGDKSEEVLGYFSKYGDGGVDFLPIAHLYKTQVIELGMHLGLPARIVNKPPSPQLWPGHKASDELPAEYGKLDLILYYLFDRKLSEDEVAAKAGVSPGVVRRVLDMHRKTEHKRAMPPSLVRV